MAGKVFISCGQAEAEEQIAARRVWELLKDVKKFDLEPYLAIDVQSLNDIMTITKELRSSDYYLFIDFKRRSLFTHQELALAHNLGFENVIALQHTAAEKPEGFLRYMQFNPTTFSTTDKLIEQLEKLVSRKGWNSTYSRNLVVNPPLTTSGAVVYGDETGAAFHESWKAKIENRRPDVAAVGAVCILDSINGHPSTDRGYLKWVGHRGYERTLLPKSVEEVDLFAVRRDQPGLFLLSTLDVNPRAPIVTENGDYELSYKVFARDFPMLEFSVKFHLQWERFTPLLWTHQSKAELLQ